MHLNPALRTLEPLFINWQIDIFSVIAIFEKERHSTIFPGMGLIKGPKDVGSSLQAELPFKPVFVDEGTSKEDLSRSSVFFGTKSSPGFSGLSIPLD